MDDLGIGIDIGASKIVVAVCRGDKAEVVLTGEGCRSTKFCVAFNSKERLFGEAAEGQFPVNPENTIHGRDVKKIIGLKKLDFENKIPQISCPLEINGDRDNTKYSIKYRNRDENLFPEHILTMFLSKIKKELESFYNAKVSKAVITVPSMFNSAQRFAIKNAVLASGIEVQQIINDSTASAITYMIERHGSDDKNILIFDMGATSTDIAVVNLSGNTVEVKACGGRLDLGGDTFVFKLMQHFIEKFVKDKNVPIGDDKQLFARLRVSCEKFKKILSATNDENLLIETVFDEPYQLKMKREMFESLCAELFDQVKDAIEDVITASKQEIDEVLIVGNGGLIPKVEEVVSKTCLRQLSKVLNRDESVAMGAAYYAARGLPNASYRVRKLNLKECTSCPLKSKLESSVEFTLVKQGELIPRSKDITYKHNEPLRIFFQQGNYTLIEHEGSEALDVFANIDINGLVKFMLQVIDKPETQKTPVNHQKPNESKIAQIKVMEAMFEKHEIEYKMKNELENLCLTYKQKFNSKELKELLPEVDVAKVINSCLDTLNWLEDTSHPIFDELSKRTTNLKDDCEYFVKKSEYLKQLQHAEQLIDDMNFKEANAVYKNIIDNFSNYFDEKQRIEMMFKRVSSLMEIEDYQEIVKLLDSSFQENLDPKSLVSFVYKRGICHLRMKNYKECINDLDFVLTFKKSPDVQKLRDEAIRHYCIPFVDNMFAEATKLYDLKRFEESNIKLQDLLNSNEFKHFPDQEKILLEDKVHMMQKGCDSFIEKKYLKELQHADQLMTEKHFMQANVSYKHIIDNFSHYLDEEKRIEIIFKRVTAMMKVEDYKESINILENLKTMLGTKDLHLLKVYKELGLCHFKIKNYKKCASCLNFVLEHEECPDIRNLRDEVNLRQNMDVLDAMFLEAKKLTKLRKFEESNSQLDKLCMSDEYEFLVLNGKNCDSKVYMMRAQNNLKLKNYKCVIRDCKIAEKDPDNHFEIWDIRAEACIELGMLDEAEMDIQSLGIVSAVKKGRLNELKRQLDGKRYQKILNEVSHYMKEKQYQMALNTLERFDVEKLEKILRLDYYCKQANLYLLLDKFDAGIEICGKALAVDKKCIRALELRAECFYCNKDYAKAIEDCEAALKHEDYKNNYHLKELKRVAVKEMDAKKTILFKVLSSK